MKEFVDHNVGEAMAILGGPSISERKSFFFIKINRVVILPVAVSPPREMEL